MSKRVIYGLILFLIAIGALAAGGIIWAIALCFAGIIGADEFIAMTQAKGMKPSSRIIKNMVLAFFIISALPALPPIQFLGLPEIHFGPEFPLKYFPLLLTIGVCLSFFRLLFRNENPPATIADIATTILGFVYVGWLPSHLILLRSLAPPGQALIDNPLQQPGLAYLWVSLFIIWATDVFAYYAGKFFGKHLLYPQISPKKTVEGALGGLIASVIIALLVVYCADNYVFPAEPFKHKLWQAPLMGAIVSIAAQLGDLCESLLKRDAGLKDSGNIIPGHGGMLDRGDGLIFGGAISYYWICLVVLGTL